MRGIDEQRCVVCDQDITRDADHHCPPELLQQYERLELIRERRSESTDGRSVSQRLDDGFDLMGHGE